MADIESTYQAIATLKPQPRLVPNTKLKGKSYLSETKPTFACSHQNLFERPFGERILEMKNKRVTSTKSYRLVTLKMADTFSK
eukprot:6200681-Pleurochrysis_carterae.AAC.1